MSNVRVTRIETYVANFEDATVEDIEAELADEGEDYRNIHYRIDKGYDGCETIVEDADAPVVDVVTQRDEMAEALAWFVCFCEEHDEWFIENFPVDTSEREWFDHAQKLAHDWSVAKK